MKKSEKELLKKFVITGENVLIYKSGKDDEFEIRTGIDPEIIENSYYVSYEKVLTVFFKKKTLYIVSLDQKMKVNFWKLNYNKEEAKINITYGDLTSKELSSKDLTQSIIEATKELNLEESDCKISIIEEDEEQYNFAIINS